MPSEQKIALCSMGSGIPEPELTAYLHQIQTLLKKAVPVKMDTVFCLTTTEGTESLDRLSKAVDHLIFSKHKTNFSIARQSLLTYSSCLQVDGIIIVDADGAFDPLDVARVANEGLKKNLDAVLSQKQGPLLGDVATNDLRLYEEQFTDWLVLKTLGKNEIIQLQTGLRWLSFAAVQKLLCCRWILEGYSWDLQCSYYVLKSQMQYSLVNVPLRAQSKSMFLEKDVSIKLRVISRLLQIGWERIQTSFHDFCIESGIAPDRERRLSEILLTPHD